MLPTILDQNCKILVLDDIKKLFNKIVEEPKEIKTVGHVHFYVAITSGIWYKLHIFKIFCAKLKVKSNFLYSLKRSHNNDFINGHTHFWEIFARETQNHLLLESAKDKINIIQNQVEPASNNYVCTLEKILDRANKSIWKEKDLQETIMEFLSKNRDQVYFRSFCENGEVNFTKYIYQHSKTLEFQFGGATFLLKITEEFTENEDSISGQLLGTYKICLLVRDHQNQYQTLQTYSKTTDNLKTALDDLKLFFQRKNFALLFQNNLDTISNTEVHNMKTTDQSPDELDSLFHFGSILSEEDKPCYKHLGVYIGNGVVAHLKKMDKNGIFAIDNFRDFVSAKTKYRIIERRWTFNPFSEVEILNRIHALKVKILEYDITEQNCEHVAYWIAMNMRIIPQGHTRAFVDSILETGTNVSASVSAECL